MSTHKEIICERLKCANNTNGICNLAAPQLFRQEEVDAFTKCFDQVNAIEEEVILKDGGGSGFDPNAPTSR